MLYCTLCHRRHCCGKIGIRNWIAIILSFASGVLPVITLLAILYTPVSDDIQDAKQYYGLTDRFIPSYSKHFCQGLRATSENFVSYQSNATLYMLTSRPPLTDVEVFSFSESVGYENENEYAEWNFYLNKGSYVTFKACYGTKEEDGFVDFYLVRGGRNYSHWLEFQLQEYAIIDHTLYDDCQKICYTADVSGQYYFIFYTNIQPDYYFSVDIDFNFQRIVYHIDTSSIVQNCTIPLDGSSSCSLAIPMVSGYTALVSLNTTVPIDYGQNVNITIDCQPRVWLYFIIVVSASIPFVAIIVCVVAYVCVKLRKRRRRYESLAENIPDVVSARVAASANSNVNTNPGDAGSNPPGGGYGATSNT